MYLLITAQYMIRMSRVIQLRYSIGSTIAWNEIGYCASVVFKRRAIGIRREWTAVAGGGLLVSTVDLHIYILLS